MNLPELEPVTEPRGPALLDQTAWRWRRWGAALAALMILALSGWLLTRGHPGQAASSRGSKDGNDAPVLDGKLIRFSEAFAKRTHLSSAAATVHRIAPVVTVAGTTTYDVRRFAAVGARIDGRIRRVWKVVGDDVVQGEALAEVESADLGRSESHVVAARAKEKAADADMKRERHLADVRIVAERDAERARAAYEAARAERIAAERTVQALGGDLRGEVGILVLKSPMAGRVVNAKAARGQTVDPTQTIFEVADLRSLWVELRVFEGDLVAVTRGDKVEITSTGNAGRTQGTVDHVGDVIDVETRTAPVRVVVSNSDGKLRPGQSVIARIHTASPALESLALPRRAITRIDGQTTVFVVHDKSTVEPRQVITGAEDGERVAVVGGLRAGERVVIEGMFALKSELFR